MKRIGRYAILGLLGRGGMGAVYKAAMPRTGRVVALKLLKPAEQLAATADAEALRQAFYREARLMAGIRHPGVAQVLDVDEDATGCPFFVMEYYCNNLGALLGEGPRVEEPCRRLGVERSLGLARQLASALARLHHEGVLHRDVKPFNMMLAEATTALGSGSSGDEVKLIDFGLSRLRGEREAGRPRGAVVGSPYYAAPEQEADPASADERADIYSAGVTLFRCLTGRLPQEGMPASALRPDLDAPFDAFFARCCAADPAQRPASARALLAELDALAAHWERLRANACVLSLEPESPEAVLPEIGLPEVDLPEMALPSSREAGLRQAGVTHDMSPYDSVSPDFAQPNFAQSVAAHVGAPHDASPPRARPLRQGLAGARRRFGLDELWRPAACALAPGAGRFQQQGGIVRDSATGLVWERGGSPYAVNLAGARAYADKLNAEGFAGRTGWRLPTVAELCTLLRPEPDLRQLCLDGAFDPRQRRLWSADAKSFVAAWYADVEHGFVWWQDATCEFFARCVTLEETLGAR
ncbi:protein kinase domain-containing protein [Humidesulfovibrio sp.]